MKNQFQTPPEVCIYMKKLLNELLTGSDNYVLEPTKGNGNLVNHAIIGNEKISGYDAPRDYFNLSKFDHLANYDGIIANPPFSEKSVILDNAPDEWKQLTGLKIGYKFLEEFMSMSDNIVILMPTWTITDSDVRFRAVRDFGLISVTPLPRKTFNYARVQTMILQLQKGYTGSTTFHTHLI